MKKIQKTKIGSHNNFIGIECAKEILEKGGMEILKKIRGKNIS
ncbi:hypothetical protein [Blattabacterium clevelandi]|nr:hypothetical protein [Blattabacterium clevelandi]